MSDVLAKAHAASRKLLSDAGAKRTPTPLVKVVRFLNISIEYTPLDEELSGMAMIKNDQKLIWINALHHPNRQRFTLAHELGHHVLHADFLQDAVHVDRGILRRDVISSEGTDEREIEANAFASELLMPESELEAALPEHFDLDDPEVVAKLAARFRVSLAAMQYRLIRR